MSDLDTCARELRRSSRFIADKFHVDRDDVYQEALIAAWRREGPLTWKIRAGNRRASAYACGVAMGGKNGRRPFGHPGGQKSGAGVPRDAIARSVIFENDAVTVDRYDITGDLQDAIAALPEKQRLVAIAVGAGLDNAESAALLQVGKAYFRQLRLITLSSLRATLEKTTCAV